MKLSTIILHVPDVPALDRCRDWYQALGLPYEPEADQPGESYWFEAGGVTLGIHTSDEPVGGATIYLHVADVDERYRTLKEAGFKFETEPETKFWGRAAYLRDPVGNMVGLVMPAPGS